MKKITQNFKKSTINIRRFFGTMLVMALLATTSVVSQAPVNIGTAGNFVVLAKSGITSTGATSIVGDIGVSPIDDTAITGFGLVLDPSGEFSTSSMVDGKVFAANYASPTPTLLGTAVGDMEAAYTDAAGRAADFTELHAGDLTGQTLTPGVYMWSGNVGVSAGGVTISGSPTDVWIFQIAGNLTIANTAIINLDGGAKASNIFWQVAGEVTLGTTSDFSGIILCQTQIAIQTNAAFEGRALAQTAVTLDSNNIQEENNNNTVCATDTPQPIGPGPGDPTAVSTANVAATGVVGTNPGEFVLDDVTLSLTHTWGSDLEIRLESPSGTILILSDNNGGSNSLDTDPTEVVFDDNSPNDPNAWPNTASANFDFFPEGGLFNAVFAGEPINGNWIISINDTVGGDGGTLFDYCINFIEIPVVGDPPQIVCPLDITVNTSDFPGDDCGAQVFFADAQAFDPEDGLIPVTQTMGPDSGSIFPVGDTIIEFSATDSDGNTSTCQFTVTVIDDVDPVAACQAITVELDGSGTVTIDAAELDGGSSDLCGDVSFSFDEDGLVTTMMFDCSNVGENTVTLYVTDEGGNVVSCEAIVTVEDNIAPEIVCNNAGGLQTIVEDFEAGVPAGWSAVTNTGNCDWQVGELPYTGYQFGSNGMFFDDDDCGSGQPASNVTVFSDVYDTTGATSLDLTYDVAYRHLGTSSFTVEVFDGATWQNVATYNANTNTTTEGPFDLLAFANSDFQVRFTYDDGDAWAWGAGFDNFLLEFETPAGAVPQYFLDMNGEVTVPITDLFSSATDNCSVVVSAGGATGGGEETLNLGLAGGNGTFGTMFDVVAIEDISIKSFDVNITTGNTADIVVYYKPGTWVGFDEDPSAWTLIGEAPGTVSNGTGVATPLNLDLGQMIAAGDTGAFYVTSTNGNFFQYTNGTGVGNVWAEDDNIQMLEGGAKVGLFTGSLFQPRVFNGNIIYTTGGGSTGDLTFTCADLGIVNVEVTATDASGNTTTCTSQIEILDNLAPIVATEDITVELGEDGTVCIEPEDIFGILPPTFEVITISSDNASASEGFTDLVVNVTEDVTVSFDWSYTTNDGALFDQFGYLVDGVFTQVTDNGGANSQAGSETVALVAGQEFGFRARSDDGLFGPATITVSNFMPGFVGQFDPANWTEVLTNSDGSATFVEVSPGSSSTFDNCGITVSALDISCFTCADIGTPVTVTLFVSDSSGNIASGTAVVTVVDNLGPVIECPADQTVDTDPDSITFTLPDYFGEGLATATDNCTEPVTILSQDPAPGTLLVDGVYTITLTAEDEFGNVSDCSFELTVETILGTEDNVLSDAIVMYPNPASSYVNVRNNSQIGLTQATIYDINGKLVSQFDLTLMGEEQRLDVSNLASGVYMVMIQSETASVVKRLIKK